MNAPMEPQPSPDVTDRPWRRRRALPTALLGLVFGLAPVSATRAQPKPRLYSARPSAAQAGASIELRGLYLAPVTEAQLGERKLAIDSADKRALKVTLPADAATGQISVESPGGNTTLRRPLEVFTLPELTKMEPAEIFAGDTITLHGTHFDAPHASYRFGRYRLRVRERAADHVVLQLPATTREGQLNVYAHGERKALGEPFTPHAVPRVLSAPRTVAAPGTLTLSGRTLEGVERFTLGTTTLAVKDGDEERGRRRALTLPRLEPGNYMLEVHSHGRAFGYRRAIAVQRAARIDAASYVVEGRYLRVTLRGEGLQDIYRVTFGRRRGRIRNRREDQLVFTVYSSAPSEATPVVVRSRLSESPEYPLPTDTEGYGLSLTAARRGLTRADKSYPLPQILLDTAQVAALLAQTDPDRSRTAARNLDRGGPPAVRERTLTAARGLVRLSALKPTLCGRMKTGRAAADGNTAFGQALAEASAIQVEVFEKTLPALFKRVAHAQLLADPAAFGLVELDRELTPVLAAQKTIESACKAREYGTTTIGNAQQAANIELEARLRSFLASVLGPALEAEALEKRKATLRRMVDAFDAPRRASLEADLTPLVSRVREREAAVVGKGVITHKEAEKVTPEKGKIQ